MIKFFRKMRQTLLLEDKTGKYLKYAIGEIVLVVIGILIALQINTWSEGKKNHLTAVNHLKTISQNVEEDLIQLKALKSFTDTTITYAKVLSRQLQTIDPVDEFTTRYIIYLVLEKQFNPNKSGNETLINSGVLSFVPKNIQDLLFEYYKLLDHIKAREEISNSFIKNKYEPYFFERYSFILNKEMELGFVTEYFAEDPREIPPLDEASLLGDQKLGAMVFGRHFQIKQQNDLYLQTIKVAEQVIEKIRNHD